MSKDTIAKFYECSEETSKEVRLLMCAFDEGCATRWQLEIILDGIREMRELFSAKIDSDYNDVQDSIGRILSAAVERAKSHDNS